MKKLFLSAIFAVIFVSIKSQTTPEEYNYITKGYKIQIESGLDMKKGYKIEFGGNYSHKNNFTYSANIQRLIRTNDNTVAGLILNVKIYNGEKFISDDYYCIPEYKSTGEIPKLLHTELNNIHDENRLKAILFCLIKYQMYLQMNLENKSKTK